MTSLADVARAAAEEHAGGGAYEAVLVQDRSGGVLCVATGPEKVWKAVLRLKEKDGEVQSRPFRLKPNADIVAGCERACGRTDGYLGRMPLPPHIEFEKL